VAVMLVAVGDGIRFETRIELLAGVDLLLRVDALSLLFMTLSAGLWLVTTIYAISYLGHKPHPGRFFGFFSLCVFATTGLALSGSLLTFFIFFEILTLSTWPLVVHKQDRRSIRAGRAYLAYALPGSAAVLFAMLWLESLAGPIVFTPGGVGLETVDPLTLQAILTLLVLGLGVKAALVPLHGWLPAAMAAPAPVSALLHAVAVVKAGAFGLVRVIHDVFGITLVTELGMGLAIGLLAGWTVLYGSWRALAQTEIKKRLAYSTVSQVSYIVLGAALSGPTALIGALAHLVHQGLMKITLFFCAGIFDERAGVTRLDQLDGMGARMPWTAACFSLGALGMIGLPPMAGFISKVYLGIGAVEAGSGWVLVVLAGSTVLNACYFLPLLHRLWFQAPGNPDTPGERPLGLIIPAVLTALAALGAGLLAGLGISPLGWATLIVDRHYLP